MRNQISLRDSNFGKGCLLECQVQILNFHNLVIAVSHFDFGGVNCNLTRFHEPRQRGSLSLGRGLRQIALSGFESRSQL